MSLFPYKDLVRLSELTERRVEWLWPDRLALGKLTLLDGDPDQGKSLLTLDWAARLTTGRALPDGYVHPEPCNVVLLSREDAADDTILPRLRAAGADLSRIHVLRGNGDGRGTHLPIALPRDAGLIHEVLRDTHARLLIVDPLAAFLEESVACLNEQMARRALEPLARIGRDTGTVVQLVRHLTKTGHGLALHRGLGAVGIIGIARSAFLVGSHPTEADLRLLTCTKNNLGPIPPTLAYRVRQNLEGLPFLEWLGPSNVSADEMLLPGGQRFGPSLHRAMLFLQETLHDATRRADEVRQEALVQGISKRTLERAHAELNVVARQVREDRRTAWYWSLSTPESIQAEHARLMEELSTAS